MHSAYTNARWMRTNFSLVYITPCTFKCLIKITRQSSNSCDAGSHSPRCWWNNGQAELPGNTLANTVPIFATRRRRRRHAVHRCLPALRDLPFATLLGSKETYLSLHNRRSSHHHDSDIMYHVTRPHSERKVRVLREVPTPTNKPTNGQTKKRRRHRGKSSHL